MVDHSNLAGGLRNHGNSVDYGRLLGILSTGLYERAIMIGSHPYPRPVLQRTWEDDARAAGWVTIAKDRIIGREQGVDETVHAQMSDFGLEGGSKRLVLVTGDGNHNGGPPNTNFKSTIEKLLSHGVMIDLWSWKASCHHDYISMAHDCTSYRGFTLRYLDDIGL